MALFGSDATLLKITVISSVCHQLKIAFRVKNKEYIHVWLSQLVSPPSEYIGLFDTFSIFRCKSAWFQMLIRMKNNVWMSVPIYIIIGYYFGELNIFIVMRSNASESLLILRFEFKTKSLSIAYDDLAYIVVNCCLLFKIKRKDYGKPQTNNSKSHKEDVFAISFIPITFYEFIYHTNSLQ